MNHVYHSWAVINGIFKPNTVTVKSCSFSLKWQFSSCLVWMRFNSLIWLSHYTFLPTVAGNSYRVEAGNVCRRFGGTKPFPTTTYSEEPTEFPDVILDDLDATELVSMLNKKLFLRTNAGNTCTEGEGPVQLTSLYWLVQISCFDTPNNPFYKTSFLIEGINCTERSPSASVPWSMACLQTGSIFAGTTREPTLKGCSSATRKFRLWLKGLSEV